MLKNHTPLKLHVSHAPFWHNGSSITEKSCHTLLACLPAALAGCFLYGEAAVGVITLSIGSAMAWEMLFKLLSKKEVSIADGNAALTGMLLAMMMPATTPWWAVICGTFFAIVMAKEIFGGIGSNPFNPSVLALTILVLSWGHLFDFNRALADFPFSFSGAYPLTISKSLGSEAAYSFSPTALLLGKQIGGIGASFGLGLIIGGLYLILRGFIRWQIALSFLAGISISATIFKMIDPVLYAGPGFHLLTGYSLIGAFFLATEDASSPVNKVPMLLYGCIGGILTVMIRNIGAHTDGVLYAILVINLINPLLDKIRPKAIDRRCVP
ncbi:MAG: electron transporter RnfD [Desulfobacterales bacterium]|nr:MAG: electron transporter RnfD [Desulfobacterales bacterium]